jgi:homotetrameric cytidine deaminase
MIWNLLRKRLYCPYSGIKETVIVKGASGKLYPGVRIENLSFPLTMNAAAVAITSCISEGDQPEWLYTPDKPGLTIENWCTEIGIGFSQEEPAGGEIFDPVVAIQNLDPLTLLTEIVDRAYVPNSGFKVAALVETDKGFVTGANIETKNWANGLCAERVALGKAISSGIAGFRAIHIYAPNADFISPCGACRQVLIEHLPHHPVLLYQKKGEISEYYTSHLLPFHFNSSWLRSGEAGKSITD